MMVSVHLALSEIDQTMGPTAYCPGTHLAATGSESGATVPVGGPAGPLELPFAIRMIALRTERKPCMSVVPRSTPEGTITIYDSAVIHNGMPNKSHKNRVLLNLNIASSTEAIAEENYVGYFK